MSNNVPLLKKSFFHTGERLSIQIERKEQLSDGKRKGKGSHYLLCLTLYCL
jgi:hypothetical protein